MKRITKIFVLILSFLCVSLLSVAQRYDKMSGYVRKKVMLQKADNVRMSNGKADRRMCAFVRCADDDVLRRYGATIEASWGDIYIVTMPINRISELSLDRSVLRIEANAPCSATVDFTAHQLNVDKVWNPSQIAGITALRSSGYTGKGVIVGVQDIGFDLTHPSFYSKDMSEYRIRAFWDQLELDEEGSEMPIGRDYTTRETLLQKAHAFDGLIVTHGTHTSTIAAGSGCEGADGGVHQSPYVGMAPEADLCFVANATSNAIEVIPEERRELYTSAMDVLGFKYIFDYADAVGKPCVINFSEGSREDLYGEDKLMFEVLGQMVGPGRIICSAAGNNGMQLSYMHKTPADDSVGTFLTGTSKGMGCTLSSSTPEAVMQLYFCEKGTRDSQHILLSRSFSISEILECEDSLLYDTVRIDSREYAITAAAYPSCYNEEQWAAELYIEDLVGTTLNIGDGIALVLKADDAAMECYASIGEFYNTGENGFSDADKTHNINAPSNAPSVIAVGMTGYVTGHENYRGEWMEWSIGVGGERCPYSSVGPTMMGLTKPDVMAPGVNVLGGLSSYYLANSPSAWTLNWTVRMFETDSGAPEGQRKYGWCSDTGTSLSCPVMAGIIALWLEACPTLTREQIMEAVAATAIHYDSSLTYPNNEYGYGEVDALAGMEYILEHFVSGIKAVNSVSSLPDVYYNLNGQRVAKPRQGEVIISSGKKLFVY